MAAKLGIELQSTTGDSLPWHPINTMTLRQLWTNLFTTVFNSHAASTLPLTIRLSRTALWLRSSPNRRLTATLRCPCNCQNPRTAHYHSDNTKPQLYFSLYKYQGFLCLLTWLAYGHVNSAASQLNRRSWTHNYVIDNHVPSSLLPLHLPAFDQVKLSVKGTQDATIINPPRDIHLTNWLVLLVTCLSMP